MHLKYEKFISKVPKKSKSKIQIDYQFHIGAKRWRKMWNLFHLELNYYIFIQMYSARSTRKGTYLRINPHKSLWTTVKTKCLRQNIESINYHSMVTFSNHDENIWSIKIHMEYNIIRKKGPILITRNSEEYKVGIIFFSNRIPNHS